MPCGHVFHEVCAKKTLKSNEMCPICRAPCKKAQKLFIDFHELSPEAAAAVEENKAVKCVKELSVQLELTNNLLANAKAEIKELIRANLLWQQETKELLEFKSTCSDKELQLRRDLKSTMEERNELTLELHAKRNAESEMETAVDNLRGENKILKFQNNKLVNQVAELQHTAEELRVLRASTTGMVGKPRVPAIATAVTRPFPPPPASLPQYLSLIAPPAAIVPNKRPKQSFEQFVQVTKKPPCNNNHARAPTGKQTSLNRYL